MSTPPRDSHVLPEDPDAPRPEQRSASGVSVDLADHFEDSEDAEPPPRPFREYIETVLIAVLVVLFLTTFAVQNSLIPSSSMDRTLLLGDYVLVNRIIFSPIDRDAPTRALAQRPLRRGDIFVFKFPEDPATLYIKRCIAVGGDVVEIRGKKVLRNGVQLEEDYVYHVDRHVEPRAKGPRDYFGPYTVPAGEYFAMGDNRDYSFDSRFWGSVPRENVVGKAFFIFWSREAAEGEYRARPRFELSRLFQRAQEFYSKTRWDRIGRIDD